MILVGLLTFPQMIVSHCLLSYVAVYRHYSSLVTFYCLPFLVRNASSLPSWVVFVSRPLFFAVIVCLEPILLVSVSCHAILVVMLCHQASLVEIFCSHIFLTVTVPHGSSALEGSVLIHSYVASDGPLSCLVTHFSLGS